MNFVGKPCAGKPHARFDEGGRRRIRLNLSLLYRRGAPRSVDRIVGESPIRLISYSAGSDGDDCSRKAQVEALLSGR